MRILGALLLLIGFALGFSPGSASASPCPLHSHTHHETAVVTDQGAENDVYAVAELVASARPDLSEKLSPKPLSGHLVPEGQACCHAAATAVPALGPALGPHVRTGRRLALRAFLPRRLFRGSDIYRPPTTT